MPYTMNPSIQDLVSRDKMLRYLEECAFETPEEVALFFTYYTYLIWDHQLFGEICHLYNDNIVMNYPGGSTVQGLQSVLFDTLGSKRGMTFQYRHLFIDIFAEGDAEHGYHFIQSTSYFFPEAHGSESDVLSGSAILPQGLGTCLCECALRKVQGRWTIVQEWMC